MNVSNCLLLFSATTENSFEFDKKATKNESLDHPDIAPGGSSNVSVSNALKGVEFIAQHIKNADKDTEVNFYTIFIHDIYPLIISYELLIRYSKSKDYSYNLHAK